MIARCISLEVDKGKLIVGIEIRMPITKMDEWLKRFDTDFEMEEVSR